MDKYTLQRLTDLENKLYQVINMLEQGKEDVLTSDQVCSKLGIGKTHLWKLDGRGITEPFYLEKNSKLKYYLLSDIIKLFTNMKSKKKSK